MTEINQGKRKHQLLTAEIRKRLPLLDSTDGDENIIAQVKFFSPYSGWTWWATEFDGEDTFFGLVQGFEVEYGTFSYRELQEVTVGGALGVPAIERDCHWSPRPVKEIYNQISGRGVAV